MSESITEHTRAALGFIVEGHQVVYGRDVKVGEVVAQTTGNLPVRALTDGWHPHSARPATTQEVRMWALLTSLPHLKAVANKIYEIEDVSEAVAYYVEQRSFPAKSIVEDEDVLEDGKG